ncbi:SsrA-binding protein SmpB [Flaviflexus equikiangi]|uniref:SsrA-binding protein n=1 Tax=Flaviflexus equikiangi TaxID=2758573 RepID=A0ABS2TEX2_9ACTO|nr:SsrA-binding protein SmpB [Flaviflexus equikiangi]MBM9432918.1 SsrA-binding protein SmpB [Flaviflexus equikiangi]
MAKAGAESQARKKKDLTDAKQIIARNKKARHEYFIDETYEAGLVLTGTEVKSLRMGRASLTEAWIEIDRRGEAWLQNATIPVYVAGTWTNHAPTRKRKLLLHGDQILRLSQKSREKGHTIVPLELYFTKGRVKVEIALARGKQEWDKRETLRRKQDDREARRAMSDFRKGR